MPTFGQFKYIQYWNTNWKCQKEKELNVLLSFGYYDPRKMGHLKMVHLKENIFLPTKFINHRQSCFRNIIKNIIWLYQQNNLRDWWLGTLNIALDIEFEVSSLKYTYLKSPLKITNLFLLTYLKKRRHKDWICCKQHSVADDKLKQLELAIARKSNLFQCFLLLEKSHYIDINSVNKKNCITKTGSKWKAENMQRSTK